MFNFLLFRFFWPSNFLAGSQFSQCFQRPQIKTQFRKFFICLCFLITFVGYLQKGQIGWKNFKLVWVAVPEQ